MPTDPAATDPPKKATNATVEASVEVVLRLRIDGAGFADIRDYADHPEPPDTPWGLSNSQLKRYIQRSDELLRERTAKNRGKSTRLHLARREALYARALQAADYRTALAVLQDLAKLLRLYPADAPPDATDAKNTQLVVGGESTPEAL